MHVLMVASENDALAGGKVGGVADVVRDVPPAIVALPEFSGTVSVVVPSYGFLHEPARLKLATIAFRFAGEDLVAELFEVEGKRPCHGVRQLVLHHPKLESINPENGRKRIYVNDANDAPFETDATRFALFDAAVLEGLHQNAFGHVDVLHLHDWHTGVLQILRRFDDRYAALRNLRTVFTIHNLALQGIRPLRGDASSLEGWFHDLRYETAIVEDPEYIGCVNPMAVGIRLSDHVHTVAPSYAEEICEPSRPKRNAPDCVFFGGEGLDGDLRAARDSGRLSGILNGCEYPPTGALPTHDQASWQSLVQLLIAEVEGWPGATTNPRHLLALKRLRACQNQPRPEVLLTSVTRVVDQKVRLMRQPEGPSPIERILARTSGDAIYILAGSGDADYETFFAELAELHENLIFLNGFSHGGADALYAEGDLFLMPSAFEPCGISQMMAMRAGQPCIVHSIGGLKDTVRDQETGFAFGGSTPESLGNAFVNQTMKAIRLKQRDPKSFAELREQAFASRFLWETSVREYLTQLYLV